MIEFIIGYVFGVFTIPLITWWLCKNAEAVKTSDEIYEQALRQREGLNDEK